MALRTKKVGVGASKVTQRGGVGAMGARRLRGSRLGLPLKGFGRCGNLHWLLLKVWI